MVALVLASAPHAIDAHDRTPLALVLATPTGEAAKTDSSEIIRAITAVLERHTDFTIQLVDERAVERCRGRLFCLADEAREDYSEAALRRADGGRMTYREHLHRLEEDGTLYPRFLLLIISVAIEGEPDRLSTLLLDTDKALALLHDTKREGSWQERVESAVAEQAVLTSTPRRDLAEAGAAADLLERLVSVDLRPALEQQGHWEPWGTIALEVDSTEPLELALDDRTIGTTAPGLNELSNVRPGRHTIRLRNPNYADAEIAVEVARGARAELSPELVLTHHEPTVLRPVTEWSGLLLVLSGAVIATFAAVRHDGKVNTVCFQGSECSHDGFTTFGYRADAGDPNHVNPPGVLMLPLGYSLATAGATWSLGTLIFGGPDDVPWIQWIAGVVLGAAAYGLSAGLGG